MKNLESISILLNNHTKTCQKRFMTLMEREMDVLSELNNGVSPSMDCTGRLHAANDGFSDVSGQFYVKGQFIPIPWSAQEDAFFMIPNTKNWEKRLKLSGEILDEILENLNTELDGIELSTGKVFKQNDTNNAYLYIKASSQGYLNIAFDYFKEVMEEQLKKIEESKPKVIKGLAPEGKQRILGTILGMPIVEGYYGYAYKVFIELENKSTVYGTLPSKISHAEIGDKVAFTSTFTVAEDDDTHAFFKRPTKPEIITD